MANQRVLQLTPLLEARTLLVISPWGPFLFGSSCINENNKNLEKFQMKYKSIIKLNDNIFIFLSKENSEEEIKTAKKFKFAHWKPKHCTQHCNSFFLIQFPINFYPLHIQPECRSPDWIRYCVLAIECFQKGLTILYEYEFNCK